MKWQGRRKCAYPSEQMAAMRVQGMRLSSPTTRLPPCCKCSAWISPRHALSVRSNARSTLLTRSPQQSRGYQCSSLTNTEVDVAAGTAADPAQSGSAGPSSPMSNSAPSWKWEESDDSVLSYSVLAGVLAAGTLPALQSNQVSDLPYFISLAVATIYIGAHRGLTTQQRQMISIKEGALAPVLASVSLFGCYLVVKYLPDLSLQTALNAYFWVLGSVAALGATGPLFRKIGGPLGQKVLKLNVPEGLVLDEKANSVTTLDIAPSDIISLVVSLALASAEVASNHSNFTLNNLMACLIATDILQLVGLRSFRTAGLMLFGLLLYDVFWVFGSPSVVGDNVMMTVATSDIITGPMRLLFPRVPGGVGEASDFGFSLLGLGDIAIPGLLACLALRYDASRVVDMKARAQVVGDAISNALAALDPSMSSASMMGDVAADAASTAYDAYADRELRQRDRAEDGAPGGGEAAAAASGQPLAVSTGENGGGSLQGQQSGGEEAEKMPVSEGVLQQRPYFQAVTTSYVGGLAIAFAANAVTHLGQPALLYIVPCTLGAVVITAAGRDELYRIWQYNDVPTFGLAAELMKKAEAADK